MEFDIRHYSDQGNPPPGIIISSLISDRTTTFMCKHMNLLAPTAFSIKYIWHILARNATAKPNKKEGRDGG